MRRNFRLTNQPRGYNNLGVTPQGTSGPDPSQQAPQVQYVEDWFIYGLPVLAIVPGATVNTNFTIDADSDFKLVKLGLAADDDTDGIDPTLVLATMQLVDTGAGRNLFSIPIGVGSLWGTGSLPFILPVPRIFKSRTNVAMTITNNHGADTYNLRFSFIGNKIFRIGN